MKEQLSSFDVASLAIEQDRILSGSHVNGIYQIDAKTLLLKFRGKDGTTWQLLIEAGRRVYITKYAFEKPLRPPSFCMALRKYLENGILERVYQYDFERIIEFGIACRGEPYRLLVELFGEGNIVLVSPDNVILQALRYKRMKDRDVLPKKGFVYPPSRGQDPRHVTHEDIYRIKENGETIIVKALATSLSIGGFYAEEVLLRVGVDKNTICSSLQNEDLKRILECVQLIMSEIASGSNRPSIFVDTEGKWVDVAPVLLWKYSSLEKVQFKTFNEALDEYFAGNLVDEKISDVEAQAGGSVARLERILSEQKQSLKDLQASVDLYHKIGDIIYRHSYELDFMLHKIMKGKREGKKWEELEKSLLQEKKESGNSTVDFKGIKHDKLLLEVSVEGTIFFLDLKKTAHQNAGEYYENAKKAKNKIEGLQEAMSEIYEKIEKARNKLQENLERASALQPKRRKREWYEKFHWFYSSDGFQVLGGRDASTNEVLVKKHVEPQDIVFHAEVSGSPFVVIKTLGKPVPEQTMKEAAILVASYSRAWREGLAAADVYWVKPEQVSKNAPSGQYLTRGSFMIYGTKNYVKNVLLETAVGLSKENEGFQVIGGPPQAISRKTNLYVRLIPGRETSGKLAKRIRLELSKKCSDEVSTAIRNIPMEEIQRFIPSGSGAIDKKTKNY